MTDLQFSTSDINSISTELDLLNQSFESNIKDYSNTSQNISTWWKDEQGQSVKEIVDKQCEVYLTIHDVIDNFSSFLQQTAKIYESTINNIVDAARSDVRGNNISSAIKEFETRNVYNINAIIEKLEEIPNAVKVDLNKCQVNAAKGTEESVEFMKNTVRIKGSLYNIVNTIEKVKKSWEAISESTYFDAFKRLRDTFNTNIEKSQMSVEYLMRAMVIYKQNEEELQSSIDELGNVNFEEVIKNHEYEIKYMDINQTLRSETFDSKVISPSSEGIITPSSGTISRGELSPSSFDERLSSYPSIIGNTESHNSKNPSNENLIDPLSRGFDESSYVPGRHGEIQNNRVSLSDSDTINRIGTDNNLSSTKTIGDTVGVAIDNKINEVSTTISNIKDLPNNYAQNTVDGIKDLTSSDITVGKVVGTGIDIGIENAKDTISAFEK